MGSRQGGQSTDCSLFYITGQEKRFIKKSAGTIGFLQNEILKLVIQRLVLHPLLWEAACAAAEAAAISPRCCSMIVSIPG